MKNICPEKCNAKIYKDGNYFRKDDSRIIKRFRCSSCGCRFSSATSSLAYLQKKRRINQMVYKLLSSGVSMRRCALILGVTRKTIKRKLEYLSKKCQYEHSILMQELHNSKVEHMQFDDLITIEHTKLKPLSVSLAVDAKRRLILGCEVSQIPAFGHLAEKSRKKYGFRESHHKKGLKRLFEGIQGSVAPFVRIDSDEHTFYPEFVRKYFPNSKYHRHKGGRGCVAGQGELKKLHYDPLFSLNHTCAMLRANINRLIRKTWCTTKNPQMLKKHLDIYINFHNTQLV